MRAPCLAVSLSLAAVLSAAPSWGAAGSLVRVPADAKTPDAAIAKVADGGVVELAAGTYASPPNGFAVSNLRKGFTVRAAANAAVAIDGGGVRPLVRFINSDRGRGKLVTFERITFQNGFSDGFDEAGGVTLKQAEGLFRSCAFVGNRSGGPNAGAGGAAVLAGATATFVGSSFRDNSAPVRGGAIEVRSGDATVQGGELLRNRVNLPGHVGGAAGGAIYVLDGTLRVSGARFEGNEAGYVGGAIYAIGNWDKGSDVLVVGSTFRANQTVPDPCCAGDQPTTGGAIHAEDQTRLRVQQSLFLLNRSELGGAIDNYRANVEVYGSVFRGNQSIAGKLGSGGAISVLSSDFPDASTGFGAVNRRPARLVMAGSLLQGGPEVQVAPLGGGCVLASGDAARMYGGTGVAQAGTLEENRAHVEIRGTVFSDCDVASPAADGSGSGGAIAADLVDLTLEDSMILDSDARGPNGSGGGLALKQESAARIVRTTFARDSADRFGGALFVRGSTVQVAGSRFYANRVAFGLSSPLTESRGAAIYTIPMTDAARPRNVGGVVSGSSFLDNEGVPVWDVDPQSGPINEMRYDGNVLSSLVAGGVVYMNALADPNGSTVAELNSLVVSRGARGFTPKSAVPNQQSFGAREGALLAVPSANAVGAGAPSPTNSSIAWAASGGAPAINGFGLGQPAGLLELGPGDYTLTAGGAAVATAHVTGSCTAGPFLCLAGNRFRAEVTWKAGGPATPAQAVSLSGDTGYFWFTDPSNVELVVKVLDGRGLNGAFWVFYGGLTNLEYTLTITDTATGAVKTYANPAGRFASNGDTSAFPVGAGGGKAEVAASLEAFSEPEALQPIADAASTCAAGPASLCLNGSRFRAELTWKDAAGHTATGQAVPLTNDTGYFWFTSPGNVEVIVKVLDGRGLNGHFWVFYGALSNLEYTLTVTDTFTGISKTYRNPKNRFASQGDTSALPSP